MYKCGIIIAYVFWLKQLNNFFFLIQENKMKKGLTEIVFILDRSGSMGGLEQDTIGGFNSMIEKQKKESGGAIISTVLFNHISEVIHDRVDIKEISLMTEKDYFVSGIRNKNI